MPTRGQLLASAWGAATSAPSSDHQSLGCPPSPSFLEQHRSAGDSLCSKHLCGWFLMYSWMEIYVFNLIFSEISVTFFLAEKCRGFELQDILKSNLIKNSMSGFSFQNGKLCLLSLSWRVKRSILPCYIRNFSSFVNHHLLDCEGPQLGLHLVGRRRSYFGLRSCICFWSEIKHREVQPCKCLLHVLSAVEGCGLAQMSPLPSVDREQGTGGSDLWDLSPGR